MAEDLSPQSVARKLKEIIRARPRGAKGNEANTTALVVVPILQAIGWGARLDQQYRSGMAGDGGALVIDIALESTRPGRRPWGLVEVKALSAALSDLDRHQLGKYAFETGNARWAVLTNGLDWEVYDMFAHAPLDQRRFLQVDLRRPGLKKAKEILLLSPESISYGRLAKRARARKAPDAAPHFSLQNLRGGPRGILEPLVTWLWEHKALTQAMCPIAMEDSRGRPTKRLIVNTEPRHSPRVPFERGLKIAEKLYVETLFRRPESMRAARILLRECGYTADAVTISFD